MPNSGVTSGDQCGQFYAAPINSTTWTLYNDDRYPLPTWFEKCGRASIPNDQNSGALAPFGRTGGFVPYNRMLGYRRMRPIVVTSAPSEASRMLSSERSEAELLLVSGAPRTSALGHR